MSVRLTREQLSRLVPHAGAMCLLDAVLECDGEEIVCEAVSHRDPDNPLRRDGRLSALHLAEYAAQATAVHGALRAGGTAQPGMLAALRDVRLHVEHVHDIPGRLTVRAWRRLARAEGSLYEFTVAAGDRTLAEGRVAIATVSAPAVTPA